MPVCLLLFFRFAVLLRQHGFACGDVIHVVTGNHNWTYPLVFGCWILGGVASLGDVNLEPRAVARQINESNAKYVICVPEAANLISKACQYVHGTAKVFSLGHATASPMENVLASIKTHDPANCPTPHVASDPKTETILIFWSSGTTGTVTELGMRMK